MYTSIHPIELKFFILYEKNLIEITFSLHTVKLKGSLHL
jgi:hypothetical protein